MTIRFFSLLVLIMVLSISSSYAENMDYAAVYKKASGSVVFVAAFTEESKIQQGSGFIISKSGLVVTNSHVIYFDDDKKAASRIVLYLKPEKITGRQSDDLTRRYDAKLVEYNKNLDLALLKIIDPPANLPVLKWADPAGTVVGISTAAIGHPVGGTRWSLTTGRISGKISDFNNIKGRQMIQMENSLNPGNSGGPLINAEGQVIGVNTATMREGPNGFVIEGINFAISGKTAMNWLNKRGTAAKPETRNKKLAPKVIVEEKKRSFNAEKAKKVEKKIESKVEKKVEKKVEEKPVKQAQKESKKDKNKDKIEPGKVFTPNDIEKMMDKMVDDMEEEFKQHRRQYKRY